MEDSETHNLKEETINDKYKKVRLLIAYLILVDFSWLYLILIWLILVYFIEELSLFWLVLVYFGWFYFNLVDFSVFYWRVEFILVYFSLFWLILVGKTINKLE